jgi:hypothetical protein
MPARADISPAQIPRLLPYLTLIDVDSDIARSRVRLAGTRLRDVYEREITGLRLDELDFGSKRDYWMAAYRHTARDGKPTQGIVRGPLVNKEHLVQYWIKLPLAGADGSSIAMILGLDFFLSAIDDVDQRASTG